MFNLIFNTQIQKTITPSIFNGKILQSMLNSNYPIIFEQYKDENKNKIYLTTHPSCHLIGEESYIVLDNMKDICVAAYEIKLKYPSFLPLSLSYKQDIFNIILTSQLQNKKVFHQLLLHKKKNNWKENAVEQYHNWLSGNESPSNNKFVRKVQNELLNLLNQSHRRDYVEEIEDKILSTGYRFEWRLLIFSEDSDIQPVIDALDIKLSELDFYNSLIIEKVDTNYLYHQVKERKFSFSSSNQFLSAEEINTLFTLEPTETIQVNHQLSHSPSMQSNQLIELLPKGNAFEQEVDYSIVDDLTKAMKRVKVINKQKVELVNIRSGATLTKATVKIPTGTNFSDIEKAYKNLKVELGYESFSIEQGDSPGTVAFTIPNKERQIVYLGNLLENEDYIQFTKEAILPFIFGVNEVGEPLYGDLAKLKHLLISGSSGSGKSFWVLMLILTLMLQNTSDNILFHLIDPKKVEMAHFEGIEGVSVVSDVKKAHDTLEKLIEEMEERYDLFAEHKCRDIYAYRSKVEKIPFVVCVIDEFADLIMVNEQVEGLVIRLAQKARAAGIHLIIATQRPEARIVTGLIKDNMPSKISFRIDNSSGYMTVFGKTIPYNLLGSGDGVMRLEGQQKEFQRFQGAVITLDNDELEKIIEVVSNKFSSKVTQVEEIVETESDLNKLKRTIATTGETRVSHLQKELGIRINTVQELMTQLVEEGWLAKHQAKSKGYELIADERILREWRLIDSK